MNINYIECTWSTTLVNKMFLRTIGKFINTFMYLIICISQHDKVSLHMHDILYFQCQVEEVRSYRHVLGIIIQHGNSSTTRTTSSPVFCTEAKITLLTSLRPKETKGSMLPITMRTI